MNDDFTDGLILGTIMSTPTVEAKTFWGTIALNAVIGAAQGVAIAIGAFFAETLAGLIIAAIDGISNN